MTHIFIITHVVAYFDGIFSLSPNNEESLNKFSSPDLGPVLDHLTGGPRHGYNTFPNPSVSF